MPNSIFIALIGILLTEGILLVLFIIFCRVKRASSRQVFQQGGDSLVQRTYYTSPEWQPLEILKYLQAFLVLTSPDTANPTLQDVKCVVEEMQLAHGGHAPLEHVIQTLVGRDLRRQAQWRRSLKEQKRRQVARNAALSSSPSGAYPPMGELLTPTPMPA